MTQQISSNLARMGDIAGSGGSKIIRTDFGRLSTPFTPASLTGLIGWWDASVTASINLTSANVNSVADQSGNSQTMSGTLNNFGKPTYSATGFNTSYPGILCTTAVGSSMETAAGFPMGTGNTLTWFCVCTNAGGSSNSSPRYLAYAKPSALDYDNDGSWTWAGTVSFTIEAAFSRNSGTYSPSLIATTAGSRIFIGTVNSSGVCTVYVDGVAQTPHNTTSNPWVSAGTCAVGHIPRVASGGAFITSTYAEWGVATGFSNATTVGLLNTYLGKKWGLDPATKFLARTSGLDTTHINAYTALIDGLIADGVWSQLDALYVFATQDSTTALLNLVSSSFTATANNSPTFTADRGFTGTASSSMSINTGFNPATATTPKFTLNSAHLSVWNVTNVASNNPSVAAQDGGTNSAYIIAKFSGGAAYFRINNQNAGSGSYTPPDTTGHFLGSRTGSAVTTDYRNGVAVGSADTTASVAVPNSNVFGLGLGTGSGGVGNQQAALSIGGGLNATDVGNLYSRLRTFMTVVGVP